MIKASDMDDLRERAGQWIACPTGDLTPEDWFGMEDDINLLLSSSPAGNAEAVEVVFRLLGRLADEQQVVASLTRAAWIDGALLIHVLRKWAEVYKQASSTGTAFAVDYSPAKVVDAMDSYCQVFHQVQWSSHLAYFLIEASNFTAKSKKNSMAGLTFARKILAQTIHEWRNGNEEAKPAAELFQVVANACTSASLPRREKRRAALQVDDLLRRMTEEVGSTPDARLWCSSIVAWSATRSEEGAAKSHQRLGQMYEASRLQDEQAESWIWAAALRSAINGWAWSNHRDTLRVVKALLARTSKFRELTLISAAEDTLPIRNAALQACAVSACPAGTRLARTIFDEIDEPNKATFYWFVASLVNGGEMDKGEAFLFDTVKAGLLKLDENLVSMVACGWARSSHPQAYERASRLVNELEYLGNSRVRLTVRTYNALLECCANGRDRGSHYAKEAERILEHMRYLASVKGDASIGPDAKSYSFVIRCWANAGDPSRAEAFLEEMIAEAKAGNDRVRPGVVVFNTVLLAYRNSRNETEALQGANEFFRKFLERYQSGELPFGPDSYSFTTLVACIARTCDKSDLGAERAKTASQLLHEMRSFFAKESAGLQLSTPLYNAVMNCWASAGLPDEAEGIFEEMLDDFNSGNPQAEPDVRSFNIVLKALVASKQAESAARADAIVARMKVLFSDGILPSGPTVVTYTTLIACHVNSSVAGAPRRAEEILQEMQQAYEQGNLDEPPNEKTIAAVRQVHEAASAHRMIQQDKGVAAEASLARDSTSSST
jgi:pentatricopeptide repeat protein